MNTAANPYAAPRAPVSDVAAAGSTQPVRVWPPDGRIGRLRYLAWSIAGSLVLMLAFGILGAVAGVLNVPSLLMLMPTLGVVAYIVFAIVLTIQRCHDLNWSGWLSVLSLVPLVNLVFLFVPGTRGDNRFGAPPVANTLAVKILASLMVVFFLLGIAAAIALPAYQQYVLRAKAAQTK